MSNLISQAYPKVTVHTPLFLKKSFYLLWGGHASLVITFRAVLFSLVMVIMDAFKDLSYIAICGLLLYVPTVLFIYKTVKLLNIFSVKKALFAILFISFLVLGMIYFLTDKNLTYFYVLGLLFSFLTLLNNLETVYFEKLILFHTPSSYHTQLLGMARQANSLSYFLSPILGGFFITYYSLPDFILFNQGIVIFYLSILYLFKIQISNNNLLEEKSKKLSFLAALKIISDTSPIVFIYSLNFLWLNCVNFILAPYIKFFYSSSTIAFILSLNGLATITGNYFYIYLDKNNFLKMNYILFSFIAIMSTSFLFFAANSPLILGLFMLLGGFSSACCYAIGQSLSSKTLEGNTLIEFNSIRTICSVLVMICICILLGSIASDPAQNISWLGIKIQNFFEFFFFIGGAGLSYALYKQYQKISF